MSGSDELKKAIGILAPKKQVIAPPVTPSIPTYQPEVITPQGIAEAQMMYGQSNTTPPPPQAQQAKGWGKT